MRTHNTCAHNSHTYAHSQGSRAHLHTHNMTAHNSHSHTYTHAHAQATHTYKKSVAEKEEPSTKLAKAVQRLEKANQADSTLREAASTSVKKAEVDQQTTRRGPTAFGK